MRSTRLLLVFIAVAAIQPQGRAANDQHPSVRFGDRTVTVTELTPGSRAILFAVGLEPKGYFSQIFRWSSAAEDADHDGSVTVDLGREVPPMTIWCIADSKTARYSIVTPGGVDIPLVPLRSSFLRRSGGEVTDFAFDHAVIDLLYFEPGGGAWTCTDADGSATERDGPNGLSTVSVDQFRPLPGASDRPRQLHPGGVLVAVDFVRMEVMAMRLDADAIGHAR